jgi:GxxExxY protein
MHKSYDLHALAPVNEELNRLTHEIIAASLVVHRELGPGLLESAYETCLTFELAARGFKCQRQKSLPLVYRERVLDCGYRLDLLVEGAVVVEVKAVDHFDAVHVAQVLSYLRLSGCKVGLLINFNVKWLVRQGVKRLVLGLPE